MIAITLGEVRDAVTTIEGGFLDFFHTVTQEDVTDQIRRSVTAGIGVFAIAGLLAWWYFARGVTTWWRYPAMLVSVYALVAGFVTLGELDTDTNGSVGSQLVAVKIAGWAWIALAVILLVLAFVELDRPQLEITAVVATFVLLAGTIYAAAAMQGDVAARDLVVAAPSSGGSSSRACVVAGGSNGLDSWDTAGRATTTRAHREVTGVGAGDRRWVAVGDGVMLVSRDGRTWNRSELLDDLHDVAWSGHQWVAVGGDADDAVDSDSEGVVLASHDGRTWAIEQLGGAELVEVASNGTSFLAVGATTRTSTDAASFDLVGTVVASTDGTTWVPRGTELLDAITWDGAQWLGVWGDQVMASADGAEWTEARISSVDLNTITSPGCDEAS